MNFSTARSAERTERIEIARRLYQALVAHDADRVIILCDGTGKVLARHDLLLEQSDLEGRLPH
jgi:hypothetical protein